MSAFAQVRPIHLVLLLLAAAFLVLLALAPATLAAPNPSQTGQPNASCQNEITAPAGFATSGFLHAEQVYAGAGHSLISNNDEAVAQYDVACFQLSNH
jgi:hypothetical protein